MGAKERVFGDVMLAFGFVERKKGKGIFAALRRQGREVREERGRAFRRAMKRR